MVWSTDERVDHTLLLDDFYFEFAIHLHHSFEVFYYFFNSHQSYLQLCERFAGG